jgi:hypothetical protein
MPSPSSTVSVGTPLSAQAIRNVNFFNGRLVTSRDMARIQAAQHEADARLGQGIGAGIVHGLEVVVENAAQRRLAIRPGLAISRAGQPLCLGAAQVLALVPSADDTMPETVGGFGPCGALSGGSYVAGNGLYLLTLAPVTVPEGRAPVLALEPGDARCNHDALVEAVQFRLLRVEQHMLAERSLDGNPVGAAAVSKWRSALAHACFGFPGLADAHRVPGMPAVPGLLEALGERGLSDCEAPLALVYLTASQGIVFVDRWAVRRRVAGSPATPAWNAWLGQQLEALGDAQLAQFQDQLVEIPPAQLAGMRATDWFAALPPAGFLDAAGARQVDWTTFLGPCAPARSVPLAPGDVRALLAQALRRDPVPLASAPPPRFRVYRIGDGGPWMFVREAPNAPHAEEVWLDGDRAGLPGVNDVQTAIDMLRGQGCGEFNAGPPGTGLQERIDALPPGSNLRLCFENGDYPLERPLLLRGLGHVIVHGGGAGTHLHCAADATALRMQDCQSVTISDVAVSGGRLRDDRDRPLARLAGAITILDVPQVRIERVAAACDDGAALGAGVVVVRLERMAAGAHVCIADCKLLTGAGQLGVLCMNYPRTDIRHNRIAAAVSERPAGHGIVVTAGASGGMHHVAFNEVGPVMRGIAVGLPDKGEGGEPVQAGRMVLAHNAVTIAPSEREGRRPHYGLFAGGADSLLVEGNRLDWPAMPDDRFDLVAIRLNGTYGRHVAVRANHMSGTLLGIHLLPLEPLPKQCLWLFEGNLAERSHAVIHCDEHVRRLLRDRDNLELEP